MNAPSSTAARARPRITVRWLLFQAHLYIGLVLCVALAGLGITGSLLVYDHELEDLVSPLPAARADVSPRSAGAIAEAAAVGRKGVLPSAVIMPHEPGKAAAVRFANAPRERAGGGEGAQGPSVGQGGVGQGGGGQRSGGPVGRAKAPSPTPQVFVDPGTLEILAVRDGPVLPILRFAHDFHGNLLLGREGRPYVGWLGVAMLGLGCSGLVLWWPRKGQWGWAFGVRRKSRGVRFHRELHGATGIWGLVVFIIVSFTGVAICFPQTVGALVHGFAGTQAGATPPRGGPGGAAQAATSDEIDRAVALAATAAPNATLASVFFPRGKDQPFRVTFAPHDGAEGTPMLTVWVNLADARITNLQDPARMNTGETVMAWQRPLHSGQGWGPVWRALVFLSGFLPLLFAITGVSMWWRKRRQRRRGVSEES